MFRDLSTVTVSLYTPAATLIVSPGAAAFTAAWIDENCAPVPGVSSTVSVAERSCRVSSDSNDSTKLEERCDLVRSFILGSSFKKVTDRENDWQRISRGSMR